MSDTYLTGDAIRPIQREPYRGRYRVNRRTGERQVWNGTTYVPETAGSLAPEASQALQTERQELGRDNLAVNYGNQFLQLNSQQASGYPWHGHLPFQNGQPMTFGNANAQAMQNIQNRFVRSQIREGTSTAGNTGVEQMRIERSGPSLAMTGPANRAAVLNLMIDRDLRALRVSMMEDWARNPQNRSLEGFEQWWARNQQRLRNEIQRDIEVANGPVNEQADPVTGRQRDFRTGARAGADAAQTVNSALRPGHREEGWMYLGGDPGDETNWERVR